MRVRTPSQPGLSYFKTMMVTNTVKRFCLPLRPMAAAALALALGTAAACAEPVDLLKRGGVTLYLRHAQSDWAGEGANTAGARQLVAGRDCSLERNLTEEGRADARALGLALKGLSLKIADIEAADLCRAIETARLAFGEPRTIPGIAARDGAIAPLGAQSAALEKALRPLVAERTLRVIIGDYQAAQAMFGLTLAEGEGLIVKTDASGKAEPLARISISDWRALSPVAASAAPSRGL